MPTRTEKERYNIADRVLALYEDMFKEWKDKPEDAASYQRARIDRLGALISRERNEEAIAEYQRMTDEGLTLPEYARYWVATAYLKDQQPKQGYQLMSSLARYGNDLPQAEKITYDLASKAPGN